MINTKDNSIHIIAVYNFTDIEEPKKFQAEFIDFCKENEILGTLMVAEEGVNGTLSGCKDAINNLNEYISAHPFFDGCEIKTSFADEHPFDKLKIRHRDEIVTFGCKEAKPSQYKGTYLTPNEWNDVISKEGVINIDTRNDYEYDFGTFEGAVNPKTSNFKQFKQYVDDNLDPKIHKEVAMFCTGGIRCEKASSYMLHKGFEKVYHLKGGILQYLEDVKEEDSMWEGECFVFDNRISVKHGIELGTGTHCKNCNRMLLPEDIIRSDKWKYKETCKYCHPSLNKNDNKKDEIKI